eukprot:m51a1_g14626 hypothetical protein (682) ;mRNA; f:1239445-1246709
MQRSVFVRVEEPGTIPVKVGCDADNNTLSLAVVDGGDLYKVALAELKIDAPPGHIALLLPHEAESALPRFLQRYAMAADDTVLNPAADLDSDFFSTLVALRKTSARAHVILAPGTPDVMLAVVRCLRDHTDELDSIGLRLRVRGSPINDVLSRPPPAYELRLVQRDLSLGNALALVGVHLKTYDPANRHTLMQIGTFGSPGCGKSRFLSELAHAMHRCKDPGRVASLVSAAAKAGETQAARLAESALPDLCKTLCECECVLVTYNHHTVPQTLFDGESPLAGFALRLFLSYYFEVGPDTFSSVVTLLGKERCTAMTSVGVAGSILADSECSLLFIGVDELVASDRAIACPAAENDTRVSSAICSELGKLHQVYHRRLVSVVTTLDLIYVDTVFTAESGYWLEIVDIPRLTDESAAAAVAPPAEAATDEGATQVQRARETVSKLLKEDPPHAFMVALCSGNPRMIDNLFRLCMENVSKDVRLNFEQLLSAMINAVGSTEKIRGLTAEHLAPAILGRNVVLKELPSPRCKTTCRVAIRRGIYDNGAEQLRQNQREIVPVVSALRALLYAGYKANYRPEPISRAESETDEDSSSHNSCCQGCCKGMTRDQDLGHDPVVYQAEAYAQAMMRAQAVRSIDDILWGIAIPFTVFDREALFEYMQVVGKKLATAAKMNVAIKAFSMGY